MHHSQVFRHSNLPLTINQLLHRFPFDSLHRLRNGMTIKYFPLSSKPGKTFPIMQNVTNTAYFIFFLRKRKRNPGITFFVFSHPSKFNLTQPTTQNHTLQAALDLWVKHHIRGKLFLLWKFVTRVNNSHVSVPQQAQFYFLCFYVLFSPQRKEFEFMVTVHLHSHKRLVYVVRFRQLLEENTARLGVQLLTESSGAIR